MVTIEEDLEMLAKSLEMGIDPFPPPKPKRPWARYAIASFLSIMMISWVSKEMLASNLTDLLHFGIEI